MWPALRDDALALGDEVATFADLALIGVTTGLMSEAIELTRRGLAALRRPGPSPERDEVRREAVAFRRSRTLESGQDLRAWLEARDLTMVEWEDHLRRSIAGRGWDGDSTELPPSTLPDDGDRQALMVDLACGGCWQSFADRAGRLWAAARFVGDDHVALNQAGAAPGEGEAGHSPHVDGLSEDLAHVMALYPPLAELGEAWCAEKLSILRRREQALEAAARKCATSQAIAARVLDHATEWTELCFDELLLASREAANEALLCAREDGIEAAELAARAGTSLARRQDRHDALPLASATLLDGAATDEPFGPVHLDDGWAVLWLRERRRPTPDDETTRSAAAEELLDDALDKAGLGLIRELSVL